MVPVFVTVYCSEPEPPGVPLKFAVQSVTCKSGSSSYRWWVHGVGKRVGGVSHVFQDVGLVQHRKWPKGCVDDLACRRVGQPEISAIAIDLTPGIYDLERPAVALVVIAGDRDGVGAGQAAAKRVVHRIRAPQTFQIYVDPDSNDYRQTVGQRVFDFQDAVRRLPTQALELRRHLPCRRARLGPEIVIVVWHLCECRDTLVDDEIQGVVDLRASVYPAIDLVINVCGLEAMLPVGSSDQPISTRSW